LSPEHEIRSPQGKKSDKSKDKKHSDGSKKRYTKKERRELIKGAQIWSPTNILELDIRRGPDRPDAFMPGEGENAIKDAGRRPGGNTTAAAGMIGANDSHPIRSTTVNARVPTVLLVESDPDGRGMYAQYLRVLAFHTVEIDEMVCTDVEPPRQVGKMQ
jgi:hypothetical protein